MSLKVESILEYTNYIPLNVHGRDEIVLKTNNNPVDEIFASLEYWYEVPNEGMDFIRNFGHKNKSEIKFILKLYRSFITQAKLYYESGKYQSYRISTLNYYYCYLNLVKAYIALQNPKLVYRNITHGLKYKFQNDSFNQRTLIIEKKGVFPILYKYMSGEEIALKQVNIMRAISYCSDVSYEYSQLKYGENRLIPSSITATINNSRLSIVLATQESIERFGCKKFLGNILDEFSKINLSATQANQLFKIPIESYGNFNYYLTKNAYSNGKDYFSHSEIRNLVDKFFKYKYSVNVFEDSILNFNLVLPYSEKNQKFMNELMSIYIITYYLSSLVRYNPLYLDKILESKEFWLIKRFTDNSHETFIRLMNTYINNKVIIYGKR